MSNDNSYDVNQQLADTEAAIDLLQGRMRDLPHSLHEINVKLLHYYLHQRLNLINNQDVPNPHQAWFDEQIEQQYQEIQRETQEQSEAVRQKVDQGFRYPIKPV